MGYRECVHLATRIKVRPVGGGSQRKFELIFDGFGDADKSNWFNKSARLNVESNIKSGASWAREMNYTERSEPGEGSEPQSPPQSEGWRGGQ